MTETILKDPSRKGLVMLTYLLSAAFHVKYVSDIWKVKEVVMIPKRKKPPNDLTSYRPVSLLSMIFKLFEKLLPKRLETLIEENQPIKNYNFRFSQQYSTIDQVPRGTDVMERELEENNS